MTLLVSLFCLLSAALGDIIVYNDHLLKPEIPEYLVIPKYAKNEVPHWSPGNGRSYIDLSRLSVQSACYQDKSSHSSLSSSYDESACKDSVRVDMLMFEAPKDKPWMSYWEDQEFCCTQNLIEEGLCSEGQKNSLIFPPTLPQAFLRSTVVKPDEPSSLFPVDDITRHEVKSSGLYILVMGVCNPQAAPVVISGAIDSMDPCKPIFPRVIFIHYIFCHLEQLLPLQVWISSVLVIALIETAMLFAHFLDWNDAGTPAVSITVIALVFGVTKRALSRVLVQLVALGYGVVRPSLGEDMNRVLYLGAAYFVLSLIYTLITSLSSNSKFVGDPAYDFMSLVIFLLAIVDTTFYIWIFTSINNLMVSLAARKQGVKYILYRNFRGVLIALLAFTGLWVVYGSALFLNDTNGTNKNWREKWTVDALWEVIYFMIFVAIAVLWAPSNNAQRYAYSIELTQLDDDSEFSAAVAHAESIESGDHELDGEYGGKLHDEKDPFQGSGALDPAMALQKKA
eukprot:scaffold2312_cov165-Ochromonas_danica.AAC.24